MKNLFVAFSHSLTQSQKENWDKIVTLKDVAPELQVKMSNIPANATLREIQSLAKAIVAEALKVGATHFFCVGEPTLTMWCNLYASQMVFSSNVLSENIHEDDILMEAFYVKTNPEIMICVQSTTERVSVETTQLDGSVTKTAVFKHVQWRKMF